MNGPSAITILTEFSQNTNVNLGRTPQHCLLYMVEKLKQAKDNNNVFAAVLTDLSKAFDYINHELLIAKLNAYGFDSPSLKFISAYLNFRKQKTKVGSTFSDYLNILFGVPQCSITVYACNMFFQIDTSEFSSYADDKLFAKHSKWYD